MIALTLLPVAGGAQTDPSAPLSAIEWLSDVVSKSAPPETSGETGDDVAQSASVSAVTTVPLGQLKLDAVGITSQQASGLPADFWTQSSARHAAVLIRDTRADLPPPLAQFLARILLAELPAPADSDARADLFLARVDKFLEIGALDQAEALLARAGPTRPELFGRWFDISLLAGSEDRACRDMVETPSIAPTYPARIFCLARSGDWDAAVVTLGTGKTLGLITPKEEALLARFLDPELFEGEPLLPVPDRITPLAYRMHEAIGEPLSMAGLPNAFSHANLSERTGWKARIAAAERLTRLSALPPTRLFALYNERQPAASGGVWDRVDAVQELEAAMRADDPATIGQRLSAVMRAMRIAGLEHAFAQFYGDQLARLDLDGDAALVVYRAQLLSKGYTKATPAPSGAPHLWQALATGAPSAQSSEDPLEAAIIAAFNTDAAPARFDAMLRDARPGEAVLEALDLLADGPRGDPLDVEHGLALLNHLGFDDVARQTALYLLLTRPRA